MLAPLALVLVFLTPLDWFSYCAGAIVLLGAYEWSALMGICKRVQRIGWRCLGRRVGGIDAVALASR